MHNLKKIIFIGISGVLNKSEDFCPHILCSKLRILKEIVEELDADLVLSSSVRFINLSEAKRRFQSAGLTIFDLTPKPSEILGSTLKQLSREDEISKWLKINKNPKDFIIIDNKDFEGDLKKKLFKTKAGEGLTVAMMNKIIEKCK